MRKPFFSEIDYENYLKKIDVKYLNRIVIYQNNSLVRKFPLRGVHYHLFHLFDSLKKLSYPHQISCSTSTHSWKEFHQIQKKVNYAFISPFFDSFSKKNYIANKALWSIPRGIERKKAIALGGICKENVAKIQALEIGGAAVLGAVWQNSYPLDAFVQLQNEIKKNICSNHRGI